MSRVEAEAAVRRQSGKAAGRVSGSTGSLLVGDHPGSAKTQTAEAHHVQQINEQEFRRLIELEA